MDEVAVPASFWTASEVLTHSKGSNKVLTRSEHIPNEIREFQTRSEHRSEWSEHRSKQVT